MNANDYDVIQEDSAPALARKVFRAIREGWQPCGGVDVQVLQFDGQCMEVWAQAIVKTSEAA